jgi:uncharacterized surface protein with fasciclin (FAS1) repeats
MWIGLSFSACEDRYSYDNEEPSWLGSNIYDYLNEKGNFKTTLRLINDLGYTETMRLTGSITLFAATDSAYEVFFRQNDWGVSRYEELTLAQKKMLLKFSIIKNAYVTDMLTNYYTGGLLYEGLAMRRETSLDAIDSLSFDKGDQLPANKYFDIYRTKGLYLMKDETAKPLVFYTREFLTKNSITDEDFSVLTNGLSRDKNDVHVFDIKVTEKDIVCKNGYINVLSKVLTPPMNMAQYIRQNTSTSIFSKLLDRFCAPYYDKSTSDLYHELNPSFSDSIFSLKYFSTKGGRQYLPSGAIANNLLPFDPGWNMYTAGSTIYPDMAAMFVPTDEAMMAYFNSGVGEILKSRFGSWENIPDNIIIPFLKRHIRTSLIESVPSRFNKMVDAENYRLPVERNHIVSAYTGVNGLVYTTNEVYPPVDYISVYSPVLLSSNTKIVNWAINIQETASDNVTKFAFYKLYLNSLVSQYSLLVPTDEYFKHYVDPVAWGQDKAGVLKYWYDSTTYWVKATVYAYNRSTGTVGDSVDVITNSSFIQNRLWEMLDNHIVVGNVESGKHYFVTKGNELIHVTGSGENLKVQGGYEVANNTSCSATRVFRQTNGNTFFLNKPIQPVLTSVYKKLSETPEFSGFFKLLSGVPDTCVSQIFKAQGIDYRIAFFNAYRYTIYVPTNAAIDRAIAQGIILPWETIYAMSGQQQATAIQNMIRFLRYHFQDDAVFFGETVDGTYQSATIKLNGGTSHFGTAKNKYYKIGVKGDANSLKLTTETNQQVSVDNSNGLVNILVKDYIFEKTPKEYKNIDGTGSATNLFSASRIVTSASAVIHQIDNVLTFQ